GFISPPIIIFTLFTNFIICLILLKKKMKSPTNIILVFIAISDMLTGLVPLPNYIYFYSFSEYRNWVPYSLCYFHTLTWDHVPTVFHTASIWLTVALAVQRYFYICRPTFAKNWCTVRNAVRASIFIYLLAFTSQLCRILENEFVPIVVASLNDNLTNVTACLKDFKHPFKLNLNIYFNIYWSLRILMVHFVPCTTLVVFSSLLIRALKQALRRRKQLLKQNRRTECRRLAENNLTTLMLVAVVGVFLTVELPLAILLIFMMLDNSMDLHILSPVVRNASQTIINFCILLSYPINFFIYCAMSRMFRDMFKSLF
ncbi:hypothetical protein HELRODRAFT_122743, partial [Helobdella robusta]|uniref:G-protein coupled receptors family 1 profile domain-containing protein n=1 Tax=Helobdella robusta TaxID=6412 RepID=T1EGV5_HELRO